jgi:ribosomal protein S18 acetylase RimI-like enzyme
MAEFLAASYGVPQQLRELEAADTRTLLAVAGGALVAFAQVRAGPAPPDVRTPEPVELWRFYVDRRWHGRGVAQRLMQAAREEAAAMGARSLWLGVWEHNLRARAFYRKLGFVEVGAHEFLLGQDLQTDVLMVLSEPDGAPRGA